MLVLGFGLALVLVSRREREDS